MKDEKGECFCKLCGAKTVEYSHNINKGLCNAIVKLYNAGGMAQLSNISLTKSEYCNFQKLKYWGLVDKITNIEKRGKGGEWMITKSGKDFVMGQCAIPEKAITYRGETIRHEGADTFIHLIISDYDYRPFYASTRQQQARI
jgi:hypothetical protein